ncbi:MAG TPA: TIGR03086 family metal-binding protein [Euzebyales bacterium]|nr:TIGR03086 family metal-binding protein [Euzebyales bacterium]
MPGHPLAPYRRAQDVFDGVLALVPAHRWDAPSPCEGWTVRDIAGHIVWGQEQLRHWATGQRYSRRDGAPGAAQPGDLAGDDPVATWRAARSAADTALDDGALGRTVTLPGLGAVPLPAIMPLMVTDLLAHAWDIGHALGLHVRVDADLIAGSFAWARDNIMRVPGFFGPELAAPPDADEQTRWLAYLGRASWQPVPA